MKNSDKKALEIATAIVSAAAHNHSPSMNAATGKTLADFFKAVYAGVKDVTEAVQD